MATELTCVGFGLRKKSQVRLIAPTSRGKRCWWSIWRVTQPHQPTGRRADGEFDGRSSEEMARKGRVLPVGWQFRGICGGVAERHGQGGRRNEQNRSQAPIQVIRRHDGIPAP